jgi:hypothetical protein
VDPVERSTRIRGADLPEKNWAAVREDSMEGAGGNMSAWNESDCGYGVRYHTKGRGKLLTLLGTMKAIGSMVLEWTL